MAVLQLLRQALSRGRAATRSILKPIRPFKSASRKDASVTTLSNTISTSPNLVLPNGTLNSAQYTAENTVRSVIETIQDAPSAPPTLSPSPPVVLGLTSTPSAPFLPTTSLPSPPGSPIAVSAVLDVNSSTDNATPHADEVPAHFSQRVPSAPTVYLRSLAPSPDLPTPGAQQPASPPTLPTPSITASPTAPPASALPIPFAQLPISRPLDPAADVVRSYMALSHLTSHLSIRLDSLVPDLVAALLKLTPADLIGATVKQPQGDQYTLTRGLGCGAMGWVMEARTNNGRTVAMKLQNRARMMGAARTQVDREAQIMAKITMQTQVGPAPTRMPCLAGSLASWTDLCFDYLVMDMYPQNLLQWAHTCAEHEFPFILVAAEMLAGLNRLHSMGYIHRDVKHENFLVSSAGHVVLADFGLAEPVQQEAFFENGTYGYIAPEVMFPGLFGDGAIDGRVDVWSLGLVFLEMYVRVQRPLYSGAGSEGAKSSVVKRDPLMMNTMRALKTRNLVFYDLLSKMLVRDPRYRWPTDALMQHEFFRGVQWDSLEEWAKANDFITTTPPRAKGLTPSEFRKRAGVVMGINDAAVQRIAEHICTEKAEFQFNVNVDGIV